MKSLISVPLPAGRTSLKLAAIAGVLLLLHVVSMQLYFNDDLAFTNSWRLRYWHVSMLDLDKEEGFGTWFSAAILLFTGQLLLLHAAAVRKSTDRWFPWWLVLGLGFVFLSVDEVAGMHEYLNTFLDETSDISGWTDVALGGMALVGLAFLPFLWALRRRTAVLFVIAGCIYLGGAVGVERWTGEDVDSLGYNMWTTLEEGMEMGGVIAMIYAVLDHMRAIAGGDLRLDLLRSEG